MNTHVFCPNCESMQPIASGPANADGIDVTGGFENGTDLMCETCRYVVATTCRPRDVPSQINSEKS